MLISYYNLFCLCEFVKSRLVAVFSFKQRAWGIKIYIDYNRRAGDEAEAGNEPKPFCLLRHVSVATFTLPLSSRLFLPVVANQAVATEPENVL